jgi:transcription-repair coupling factor (superfamily II helicase)
MKKIISVIQNNPAVLSMLNNKAEIVTINELDEAYLIATRFSMSQDTIIIVKDSQYQAQLLYQQLKPLLQSKVHYFPADESLRVEALAYSFELLAERVNTLYNVSKNEPCVIICHMHSLIRHVPAPRIFNEHILTLKVGDIIEPADLRKKLIDAGYTFTQRVDQAMYFAKRGGVIDVFSIQYDAPIRIEFFDDEIESIRFFDTRTQRGNEEIKEVTILPASDLLYDETQLPQVIDKIDDLYEQSVNDEIEEELSERIEIDKQALINKELTPSIYQYIGLFDKTYTILDYLDHPIIITNKETILNQYNRYVEENFFYFKELQSIGHMLKGLTLYKDPSELLKNINIQFLNFATNDQQILFQTHEALIPIHKEESFIQKIKDDLVMHKVFMCLADAHQIRVMSDLMENNNIHYSLTTSTDEIFDGVNIYLGNLQKGIEFVEEKVIFYTATELFGGIKQKKGYVKYKDAKIINDYNELNVGDYVVHDVNGIGQYLGIKTLNVKGVHKDYLYIAYKGNDTLYIPVENFRLVRKYSSKEGRKPQLHSLGSTKWQKEKQRVRQKVEGLADDLIALYSERMKQPGFAFVKDDHLQEEFENDFGYELTPDQKEAVKEIKKDMETPRPMDRLLCGDVGFGKTEVALRAAFKAILSQKQVAFLCPTTILSSQHYHTMIKRFENFPVEIAVLNRFTKTKEKNRILKGIKDGSIDILVGTHRILSKDIEFKDLGLLCIDEEQRFGVRQKEKIKEYRKTIDVLTLSATPIPRTLQMSLMGIRGLSQIETPPLNRLPVQTYVVEKNDVLIKQVIERELGRHGQVFYLHNRRENIERVASRIQALVPNAKVGVGHGQMKKEELEDVMNDFINKEYDVLVCTTIIETGIDIPNANTILVEDADHFGLAQLYQIKGRVGRSERVAYAYLMYQKNKQMNEEASKRLKAIKEFAQLGSGYKIAMRDLSIRGSGDILGGEQAGFIDTVGFDMYMKILQEAINEKKGEVSQEKEVPVQNIQVDGYIPENYVENDIEKLNLYQKVYNAKHLTQIDALEVELKDLYGTLPREVKNIVLKRKYEILCVQPFMESVKEEKGYIQMILTPQFSSTLSGDQLFERVNQLFQKAKFQYVRNSIILLIPSQPNFLNNAVQLLSEFNEQYV